MEWKENNGNVICQIDMESLGTWGNCGCSFLLCILSYHSGLFLWMTLLITQKDFLYFKDLKFTLLYLIAIGFFVLCFCCFFLQPECQKKIEMMDKLHTVADFLLEEILLTVIFVYYSRAKSNFACIHLPIPVKNINIRTVKGSNYFQNSGNVIQSQYFRNSKQFTCLKKVFSNILKMLTSYKMFPINANSQYTVYTFISAFAECGGWVKLLNFLTTSCACDFSVIQLLTQIAFVMSNLI